MASRLTSLHGLSNYLTNNNLDSIGYLFRLQFLLYCMTLRYLYVLRLIKNMIISLLLLLLGNAPNGVSVLCRDPSLSSFVVRSSITKWAGRISQEQFDLESPNFTWTSVPALSTASPDTTSLATSSRKLSWENCRYCRLRWLWVRFIDNGLSEDHTILPTYREHSASQTGLIWHCFRSFPKCN